MVLGLVLLYDGRVLELKRARAEIRELDNRIANRKRENASLRAEITVANRGGLPAEKAAREELHLVHPEDIVLLYPAGALAPQKPTPATTPPVPASPSPNPATGRSPG